MKNSNNNEFLFMQLIVQNQQLALVSMGKLENPMNNEIEINLELAKLTIDTLEMLKEKTAGNLNENEDEFLINVINDLKFLYIDLVNRN